MIAEKPRPYVIGLDGEVGGPADSSIFSGWQAN